MSSLSFILLLCFSHCLLALQGVVVSTQTPLFLKESEQSEVSEYRLKGDIVFIHGSHNTLIGYFQNQDFEQTKFYRAIDRLGRNVYVRAEDIFIYYNDARELEVLSE